MEKISIAHITGKGSWYLGFKLLKTTDNRQTTKYTKIHKNLAQLKENEIKCKNK